MKLVLIVVIIISGFSSARASDIYLTYSHFIQEVQAGHIKSATLDKYADIQGMGTINGKEQSFYTYAKTGSINDPLLVTLLNDKSVQITTVTDYKDILGKYKFLFFFAGSSMVIIPWITFALVILLLFLSSRIWNKTKKTG